MTKTAKIERFEHGDRVSFRISESDIDVVSKLERKLGVSVSSILRMGIRALAREQNITQS